MLLDELSIHNIQLWEVVFDEVNRLEAMLSHQLSVDEKNRANHFHFARDRRAYVIIHGVLRCILGHYLRCDPKVIKFTFNLYGKPFVEGISFNISYTQDAGILAFTDKLSIGIDIERVDNSIITDALLNQVLSHRERIAYQNSSDPMQLFFEIWTRKEAYIKALGTGLSIPIKSFVALNQSINDYYFHSINISVINHVANVAVNDSETQISTYSVNKLFT